MLFVDLVVDLSGRRALVIRYLVPGTVVVDTNRVLVLVHDGSWYGIWYDTSWKLLGTK